MKAYKSITFILSAMIFLTASIAYKSAYAENYANIYSSTELSSKSSSGNEVSYDKPLAVMMFGIRTNGSIGVSTELFFNNAGGGATLGGFAKYNDFVFSIGAMSISDISKGNVEGFSRIGESNGNGDGFYVGVSYKVVSIRLIKYDIEHKYLGRNLVGYSGTHHNKKPIFENSNSKDSLTREMLWIGVNFPF